MEGYMAIRIRITELIVEKRKREGRNIAPGEIARVIGVSHNTIFAYMANSTKSPDLDIPGKLQDYFECSIEDLFEYVKANELEKA